MVRNHFHIHVQSLGMPSEQSSRMQVKARLIAEIAAAESHARSGRMEDAEEILRRIARDPDAAVLGANTMIGLPRKLHSAWLRLAKLIADPVRIAGLRATAIPPADVAGDLFTSTSEERAALVAAASSPVPRLLHQIWVGGPPPAACKVWAGYAAHHGWQYRLWDEPGLEDLGIADDPLWRSMLEAGDLPGAVDIARYHLLLREGGIYLDCDWYPARADLPPDAVFPGHGLSVVAEPSPRLVADASLLLSNALIAAPVGHPALRHLLAALPEFARRLPGAPAWWVTGPLPFTMAARRGPVTVLESGLVAGSLPRGAPLADAVALAERSKTDDTGFLVAWKSW
jgi:inositol phosphorylceramide mannosyltransferase catalytic subunit